MNAKNKPQYRAMVRLTHSKTGETIEAGEVVNLDHLYPDVIQQLQEMGAVDIVPEIKVVKVEGGGDDNRR